MDKKLIYLGVVVGSTLGGLVPMLWGAGAFSGWGIIMSGAGGLVGIWAGYRLANG